MKTLYLDCFSGIAGDMAVGACLDAGASFEAVRDHVEQLVPGELTVRRETVMRGALRATHFVVDPKHAHEHHHRTFPIVREMLEGSSLPERARNLAIEVFSRLAHAEAGIHGTTPEEVHFHEVGALDSIADVVGFAVALDDLDIDGAHVRASRLPWTEGKIEGAHGELPSPAPATTSLLKGFTFEASPVRGEIITPTGAAILAATAGRSTGIGSLQIEAVGYGAGTKEFEGRANVVRAVVGVDTGSSEALISSQVSLLETNIDDMDPRLYPALITRLLDAGALDAWLVPIQMKKGRPGTVLSVLARIGTERDLAAVVLSESTTLGVRWRHMERLELPRETVTRQTRFGPIRYKVAGGRARPEFEDCRAAAEKAGVSIQDVLAAAHEDWKAEEA